MWHTEHELVKKARLLATEAHKGQHRWGGEEYITHPEAVAAKVKKANDSIFGPDVVELSAAWLHDVVEDTDITLGNLLDAGFGYEIIRTVDDLTHRDGEEYDDYLGRLKSNPAARHVKIADITHNLKRGPISRYKSFKW